MHEADGEFAHTLLSISPCRGSFVFALQLAVQTDAQNDPPPSSMVNFVKV